MQSELVHLKLQIQALQETIGNLSQENDLLRRRLYGTKSERSHTSELQMSLGDLLDVQKALQKQLDEAVAKAAAECDRKARPSEKRKSHGGGRPQLELSKLPRVVVEVPDPDLERTAQRMGFEDSYQYLRQRGGWSVLVKRTIKYEVAGSSGPSVVAAPQPPTLFPKGLLHSSAVAHLLVQKFALGVPHHRLEQHMQAETVRIDRSTMCRYAEQAGGTLGATIVHAMWQDALEHAAIISTDATSALIQPEKGSDGLRQACKKGHFFTAVADCDHVLFAYVPRHTQDAVKALFQGFRGYLQCDASNVYDVLERGAPSESDSVSLVGCFAHCRRYFFEAAICRYPIGAEGLARIRAMYAVDDGFQKLPPIQRAQLREQHLRPLMDDFFRWVHDANATVKGRNLATRALGYAINQERELRRVLEDPRLPPGQHAGRTKPPKNRRRSQGMDVLRQLHARGESAAALFTLIASCRLHRVDPERYFDEVLRLLPYWPSDRYLELAPKLWTLTRAKLAPKELEAPLGPITVPAAA